MKNTFILLLLSLVLCSCSPQKQLERLIKRYPELLIKDTVKLDTIITIPEKNASFDIKYIYKDSLITLYSTDSIKLTYTVTNDSIIKVYVHVPPEKVPFRVYVPYNQIKYITPDNWGKLIDKIPYIFLTVLTIAIVGLYFRKK